MCNVHQLTSIVLYMRTITTVFDLIWGLSDYIMLGKKTPHLPNPLDLTSSMTYGYLEMMTQSPVHGCPQYLTNSAQIAFPAYLFHGLSAFSLHNIYYTKLQCPFVCLYVCMSVCLYPPPLFSSTRPSDHNQIWHTFG